MCGCERRGEDCTIALHLVEADGNLYPVVDLKLQVDLGFRVLRGLAVGEGTIQHAEDLILRNIQYRHGKEVVDRNLDLNIDQRTGRACKGIVKDTELRVLADGELSSCGRTSLQGRDGKDINDSISGMNADQSAHCECQENAENGKDTATRVRVDENTAIVDQNMEDETQHPPERFIRNELSSVPLETSGDATKSEELGLVWPDGLLQSRRSRTEIGLETGVDLIDAKRPEPGCGEALEGTNLASSLRNLSSQAILSNKEATSEDATPVDEIEVAQSQEGNTPERDAHQYPVPLSPLSGEVAKTIEYERAMVAEIAMKSGPAMTRSGVLFEDEWLLVINKPCGIYSEHVLATAPFLLTPAAAIQAREPSLSRLTLRHPVDKKDASGPHLHMANRLDRDTSGLMVITKCKNAAGKLSNIFTKRQVQKSYIALCGGPRPSWKKVTVDSGHGRSRFGAWRVYAKKDVGRGLPGRSVVRDMTTHLLVVAINKQTVPDEQVDGRTILEDVKNIDYVITAGDEGADDMADTSSGDSSDDGQSSDQNDEVVIRAVPLTGRTHQIRLHCQFVGLPLRGDVKYGGPHSLSGVRYDHHALHAESISFKHPFTFEDLHFVAPLPQWATDAGVQPLLW